MKKLYFVSLYTGTPQDYVRVPTRLYRSFERAAAAAKAALEAYAKSCGEPYSLVRLPRAGADQFALDLRFDSGSRAPGGAEVRSARVMD